MATTHVKFEVMEQFMREVFVRAAFPNPTPPPWPAC